MRTSIWEDSGLRDHPIDELRRYFNRRTWIDVADPTVEDLKQLAEVLDVPREMLIGKLGSNYPHVDSYPQYTKIFAWYLSPASTDRRSSFDRSPVVLFTNGKGIMTISESKTGIRERVAEELSTGSLSHRSISVRVVCTTMTYLLESYEHFAEHYERHVEKFEEAVPPWSRHFYVEAYGIQKEANSLLKLLRRFRLMIETLASRRARIPLTEEERCIIDTTYNRAIGAEETVETSLETLKDLIGMHLDTVSHDMNKTMRLLAAITVVVAIPTVIGSLLGMNLVEEPWPWTLWQVTLVGAVVAILLLLQFYRRGWLVGP